MRPPSWMPGAALFLAVMGAPSPLDAQTITGAVLDDFGAAVPHARVSLRLRDGDTAFETEADADGVFLLKVPETGEYHLVADAPGHLPLESRLLAIDAGRPYELDLELTRAPAQDIEHEVPRERYEEWVRRWVSEWRTREMVYVIGPEWRNAATGRTLYEALEVVDLPGVSYRSVGNGELCPQSRSSTRCLDVSVLSHSAPPRLRDIEADEVDGLVFVGPGGPIILFLGGYLLPDAP